MADDNKEQKRRPYARPVLKLVDLLKLGEEAREKGAADGFVVAQAISSVSNVQGVSIFGSKGGPPPGYFSRRGRRR